MELKKKSLYSAINQYSLVFYDVFRKYIFLFNLLMLTLGNFFFFFQKLMMHRYKTLVNKNNKMF